MTESYKPTLMQLEFSLAKKIAMTVGLMLALMVFVYSFGVPNPNMVLIAGLVFCSALFGFGGGIVAAVLMVGYTLFFFSTDHCFVRFTPENTQKVVVTLIGVAADMLLVCQLKRAEVQAFREVLRLTEKLHQENELLQSMSLTDALTGIRNRLALRQDYDSYLHRKASVMMMDLNDFKGINDTLGHSEGDRVLRETGQLLADAFGAQHCYRYGGDEFLIIAENETEETFTASCEEASRQLEAAGIGFSGGYVYGVPESIPELRGMIMQADEMLYVAKESGKNQFVGGAYDHEHVPSQESAAGHRSHIESRD
jgi:diguanylate cyclase (GGDEF)-like protein